MRFSPSLQACWYGLAVATLLNFGLRAGIPGYVAAEPIMAFTPGMKIARLTLAVIASLAAGAAAGSIAPASRGIAWLLGAIILAMFIPVHIHLWAKFPVWYHLVFLVTLVPLVGLGAAITRGCQSHAVAETMQSH